MAPELLSLPASNPRVHYIYAHTSVPKQPSPHPAHTFYMARELPFFVSSPDLVFLSDDEGEKEVTKIEDSDCGGDTHVYLSSDEEDDAVYADDGSSYANCKAASAAATSLATVSCTDYGDDNPNGGDSNGDGNPNNSYFDDNDNDSEDGGDDASDFSSAATSKSPKAPYNYWHPTDLCTLVEIDGQLLKDFEGATVPSSVLYEAFMEDPRPIRRGGLTSRKISYKRYQLKKKFRAFCKLDPRRAFRTCHTAQECKFYTCCKEAWPHIVEEGRV